MLLLIALSSFIISIKRRKIEFVNLVYGVVIGVTTLFWITEILSLFKMITFAGILLSWTAINGVAFAILIKRYRYYNCKINDLISFSISKRKTIYILVIAAILMVSVVISYTIVPCNYDSMTYHLSRLVHWEHNKSVSYYATHTLRQLTSPMLSEYIMLHTYIITGCNDHFVNLVQTFSHIFNVLMILNIGKKLGLKPFYSFIASFVYMTTPIVVAESFTTQNDILTTVWLLIFVYILLHYLGEEKIIYSRKTAIDMGILGQCIALGYLSKPSVCMPIFFFLLWLLICCIKRKDSIVELLKCACTAGMTMIIPLVPQFYRNYAMMGQLTSHITGARQLVGTFRPNYLIVNFLKNLTFNFPNILDHSSSEHVYSFIVTASNILRVEMDDPSISEDGVAFSVRDAFDKGMDSAVNPIIVGFIIATIVLLIVFWIRKLNINTIELKFSAISIIAFMGTMGGVRWEPFVSRYMIANFALCAVGIAIALQVLTTMLNRYLGYVLISILILGGISEYVLTMYDVKGWYNVYDSRVENYYTLGQLMYSDYKKAADYIIDNNINTVGLLDSENDFDYPFYKMIEDYIIDYRHVLVKKPGFTFNDSYKYEDLMYQPEGIFVISSFYENGDIFEYNGAIYKMVYSDNEGWTSFFIKME